MVTVAARAATARASRFTTAVDLFCSDACLPTHSVSRRAIPGMRNQ
jgi:hypothetical protein